MRLLTVQKIQKPVNFSSGIRKHVLFYVLYKLPFLKWPNLAARINKVHLTLLKGLRRLNLIMLAQVIMRVSICNQTVPCLLQHWSNQHWLFGQAHNPSKLSEWPEHVATPYSRDYCFFQARHYISERVFWARIFSTVLINSTFVNNLLPQMFPLFCVLLSARHVLWL